MTLSYPASRLLAVISSMQAQCSLLTLPYSKVDYLPFLFSDGEGWGGGPGEGVGGGVELI